MAKKAASKAKTARRCCVHEFFGYSVVIDRRVDPAKLGPFFAYGAGQAVGHSAFFWTRRGALDLRRELAKEGFSVRVVAVIVRMGELPHTHPKIREQPPSAGAVARTAGRVTDGPRA